VSWYRKTPVNVDGALQCIRSDGQVRILPSTSL